MSGSIDVLGVLDDEIESLPVMVAQSGSMTNADEPIRRLREARAAVVELIKSAKNLRKAQRAYMADRGNALKGQAVADAALALDYAIAGIQP